MYLHCYCLLNLFHINQKCLQATRRESFRKFYLAKPYCLEFWNSVQMGIYCLKVKLAYSVNWNQFCSVLCHCFVEFDKTLSQCWLEV